MSIIRARQLRRDMTDAEKKLWRLLRSRTLADWKFRRQHHIGPFIADFACVEVRLIIEADGGQHCESLKDHQRTNWLDHHGWHVLRFWNNDILQNTNGVAETVLMHLRHSPLPEREREGPIAQQWEGEGAFAPPVEPAPSPVSLSLRHRETTSPVEGEVNNVLLKYNTLSPIGERV